MNYHAPLSKVRVSIMMLMLGMAYLIIFIHLALMQIVHGEFFRSLRHMQSITTITVPPPRGIIYDRFGEPLALNQEAYSACIVPATVKDRNALASVLADFAPRALERFEATPTARFLFIKRHLTKSEEEYLRAQDNPDIFFITEPIRYYVHPSLCSILGVTNSDHIGICGLELWYNSVLAGSPTTYLLSRTGIRGTTIARTILNEGVPGEPLHTTLDSTLQQIAQEELVKTITYWGSEEGALIIIDPETGDILALANAPTGDPNDMRNRSSECFTNRALIESFEFGSVMKVFPALAALDEGVVTLDEEIDCENTILTYIEGMKITTWKACGMLPYRDVIALSNNIGTSKVTERLGKSLYHHLRRIGFGSKTGIAFPGEEKGHVTHPSTWSRASLFSLSFGYEIRATLLQLARAFCLFSNGGYLITPRLDRNLPILRSDYPLYPPNSLNALRECIARTITHGNSQRAALPGVTVLGKTGSANLIVDGAYDPRSTLFSFACIVEKENYKRVIVTFIKKASKTGILAATVAVPLVRAVAERMLIHEHPFHKETL